MPISIENTKNLTSNEFIEKFSIELWNEDNIYLINEPKVKGIPEFFYISAYLIEFITELEMSGLVTLLTNSSTYNFENALNSLKEIGSTNNARCLEEILKTLNKYGMTPVKMREQFLNGIEEIPEHSVITIGQFFKEKESLLKELEIQERQLNNVFDEVHLNLETYLIRLRGI